MADVDSLKIKVSVDTGKATDDIKAVADSINALNTAAKQKGISGLEKSLKGLSSAATGLQGLDRAVKSLQNLKVSPKIKQNLDKLADATARLSQTGSGIKQFADGLDKMQKVAVGVDLDKKFSQVAQSVSTFANELDKSVSNETVEKLVKIADALEKIAKASNKVSGFGDSTGKAVKTNIKWQSITKAVETVNRGLSDIGRGLYGVLDASGIIGDLDRMTGAISKNIPVLGELTSAWRMSAGEIKNIVLSQANVVDKAASLMLVKVKFLAKALYSLAKLPFSEASMKATAGIVNLVRLPIKQFSDKIVDLTKRWNHFISSISRVAVYRLIRTALKEIAKGIKEGVQNLYQWGMAWKDTYSSAKLFVDSMDRLSTAFLYLKNSIGAAVSPLIDYFAPAIDLLIDKFVELINVVNQTIAVLSGASLWRKALKYQYSYAEAANLTAKALKRTVLAFDELNKLDDKNKGGKGDDLDYSRMFEERPIEKAFADMLNSSNWRNVGQAIADKINEGLANIDWTKIQKTAVKWSTRIGSLLDGLLLGIDMTSLGDAVARGINTIALSINTFFDQFHFRELGQHLADGVQKAIEMADWSGIGRAITQKIKAAFELVIGFKDVDLTGLGQGLVTLFSHAIDNVPISEFVDAIATLIPKIGAELGILLNGIFTKTNEVMGTIDFKNLGSGFSEGINNMLEGIDAKEAGRFLTNGLSAIIKFTSGAIENLDWDLLNTSIGDMIVGMFENIDISQAVQNAVTLAEKIVDVLNTVVTNIPWDDIGTALEGVDTSGLKDGIKKLIENLFDGIERSGFLDEITAGVGAFIGLKLGGTVAKLLPSILTIAATKGLTASGGAAAGAGALGTAGTVGLGVTIGSMLGQQISHHIIGPILEGLGSADAELYKNWTFFGEGGLFEASIDLAKMKLDDFETALSNFGSAHKTVWDSLKEGDFGKFITSIGDAWKTEHPIIVKGIDGITDALKKAKQTLTSFGETWLNFSSEFSEGLEYVATGLSALTGINLTGIDALINASAGKKGRGTASLKRKAVGGTVDRGDLFLAGESGPEIVTSYNGESAVMNMEQIISTISQSVAMASGGGDITIPIILDGGVIDKRIITAQQRQSLRSGK